MNKTTLVSLATILLCSCAELNSPQGQAVIKTGEEIAQVAITATTSAYGAPLAGQLASAGLDALASVLQGYIDKTPPPGVIKAAPGVRGLGKALAPLIATNKPISQADVNKLFSAAKLARTT